MSKFYVPTKALTPADRVREALDKAEPRIVDLRRKGQEVLSLLYLLDHVEEGLAELAELGADARSEEARFEGLQRKLRRQQERFLREAGHLYQQERAAVQPERERWWWFMDEAVAEARKKCVRRVLIWGTAVVAVLVVAWLAYDRFLAPPPEVRESYMRRNAGEYAIQERDYESALVDLEAAVYLSPADPDTWILLGIAHEGLENGAEAEEAFGTAHALFASEYDFLLARTIIYIRSTLPEKAYEDANSAVELRSDDARAYYLRSVVEGDLGRYTEALADMDYAESLADPDKDVELVAIIRIQRGMLLQLAAGSGSGEGSPTPVP